MPAPEPAVIDGGQSSRLARLRARLAGDGVAATVRKAFGDHVYRRSVSVIVEYRRGWRPTIRPTFAPSQRLVTLRAGDTIPPLCEWMAWRRSEFEAMLVAGKMGAFVLNDGVAVACAWISLTDHRDAAAREFYAVGPREAYHYCWMVEPAMRQSTIAIALIRETIVLLAEFGIERQFGVVDLANRASYLIQYRLGYRECGRRVVHYYVLGTRWTRMSSYRGTLGPAPAGSPQQARG